MNKINTTTKTIAIVLMVVLVISVISISVMAGKKQASRDTIKISETKNSQKPVNLEPISKVKDNEQMDEAKIIDVALNYATQLGQKLEKNNTIKVQKVINNFNNIKYYEVRGDKLDVDLYLDLSLKSFTNKTIKGDQENIIKSEKEAKKLIEKYMSKLDIRSNYEFGKVVPFIQETWQASYYTNSQEIKDPYNMIKLVFSKQGIEDLRVHKTKTKDRKNEKAKKLSKEEAIDIVKKQFKDIKKVEGAKIQMVAPNNFFDNNARYGYKEESRSVKAWVIDVITPIKNQDTKHSVYVDVYTGEIIGGVSYK